MTAAKKPTTATTAPAKKPVTKKKPAAKAPTAAELRDQAKKLIEAAERIEKAKKTRGKKDDAAAEKHARRTLGELAESIWNYEIPVFWKKKD